MRMSLPNVRAACFLLCIAAATTSCSGPQVRVMGSDVARYEDGDPVIRIKKENNVYVITSRQVLGDTTLTGGEVRARQGEIVIVCNETSASALMVFAEYEGSENLPGPFSNRRWGWVPDTVIRVVEVGGVGDTGETEKCRKYVAHNRENKGFGYAVLMIEGDEATMALPSPSLSIDDGGPHVLTVRPKIIVAGG